MAAREHKKYVETTAFPGNTHLEISVYYSKGGTNCFNGRNDIRGFYLSVTPVKRDRGFISYVMFSGLKKLILPATRFSEKQFIQAIENSAAYEQELIDAVISQGKSA